MNHGAAADRAAFRVAARADDALDAQSGGRRLRRDADSVCRVVHEGGEGRGCQFSFYCDGRSDVPFHTRAWREAGALAYELLADRLDDTTEGALFYHATWIDVPWKRPREKTRVIGQHAFYR